MTDLYLCQIDESAGLAEQTSQTSIFGEVEAPESVLVYCGHDLTQARRVGDRFFCDCGAVVGVAW